MIATNVYNSVAAPVQRGFSYIEIWMLGIQIPILVGVFEYGILLAMKKYYQDQEEISNEVVEFHCDDKKVDKKKVDMNVVGKNMDKWTFIGSLLFIIVFNIIYWCST